MNVRHGKRSEALAWFSVTGVLTSAGATVYSLVAAEWTWAGAAALATLGSLLPGILTLVAGTVALLAGAWPAAVGPAITGAAWTVIRLTAYYHRPGPLDEAALSQVVHGLPRELRERVEEAAHGRVDSLALLRTAVGTDPFPWRNAAPETGGSAGAEGGLVDGTCWTLVAAEAALVADGRPDPDTPLDVQILAAAAAALPHSAAQAAFGTTQAAVRSAGRVLGLSNSALLDLIVRASRRPGGELLAARARLPEDGAAELTDEAWRALRAATLRSGGGSARPRGGSADA